MVFKELLVSNPMSLRKKLSAVRANKGSPLNGVIRKFRFRDWSEDRFSLLIHSHSLGNVCGFPVGDRSFTETALYITVIHTLRCPMDFHSFDFDAEFVFHTFSFASLY